MEQVVIQARKILFYIECYAGKSVLVVTNNIYGDKRTIIRRETLLKLHNLMTFFDCFIQYFGKVNLFNIKALEMTCMKLGKAASEEYMVTRYTTKTTCTFHL